jgi:alkylhydroperoxidase family enzyme
MTLALAAFLLLPHVPELSAFVPVIDTLVLLTPVLAACFVVGWWAGGPLSLAVLWTGMAAWLLSLAPPSGAGTAYYDLARAWGLVVAGAFGLVCVIGRQRSFLERALSAIVVAALLAFLLLLFTGRSPLEVERIVASELQVRNASAAALMQESAKLVGERFPQLAKMSTEAVGDRVQLQDMLSRHGAPLFPALLAIEALAACALAWALYHRLSRARIGAALAPLRRFSFSDQLIWALVAGIAMIILPTLAGMGAMGRNLILFVGTLYVLRGFGIYAWLVSRRTGVVSVFVAIAVFPLSLLTVFPALGLGVTDTWANWRERIRMVPPESEQQRAPGEHRHD